MTLNNSELSSVRVAEWKNNVRSFFRSEWSQLRQLVLELEEEEWGRIPASAIDADVSTSTGDATLERLAEHLDLSGSDEEKPRSDDRLAQLAQSIEMRMQTNNGGEF